MQVQVDTRDNNIVYAGFQFGNYFRINKTSGERKYFQMPRKLGEEQLRFNWKRHSAKRDPFWFTNSTEANTTIKTISTDFNRGNLKKATFLSVRHHRRIQTLRIALRVR
jgi:hypothetical protein